MSHDLVDLFMSPALIAAGPRHIAKSDTKTLLSKVISGDVARHLLINFHLYSWCCLHTSAHLAFNLGVRTGSMCAIY